MRLIPEPFDRDVIVLAPAQLRTDMEIVNLGKVLAFGSIGMFISVDVEVTRWSLSTGAQVTSVETVVFHSSDDVWVFEPPVQRKFDPTFGGKVVAPEGEV